jgi:NAD(P)-dependent dehydrogenase (short-subunit alcohol dehydrogenase family)
VKIPAWVPFTGHRTDAGVVDLGLKAPFFLTRAFLPLLEAGGTHDDPARAINVGSIGRLRVPSFPTYSYSASKAGLHHLTRVLARELGPRQITVNAVAPGPFESSMMAATLKTFGDAIIAEAPLRRIGRPTIRAHPRGDREAGVRARPAADPFGPVGRRPAPVGDHLVRRGDRARL